MARLTRITTRTGDDGTTGLAGGERISKDSARIEAIGGIDELNSTIGLLRAVNTDTDVETLLEKIQHRLFDLGGELAMPGQMFMSDQQVAEIEDATERFNAGLPPLKDFVLPGGSESAARCHLARAICRRAERDLWRLSRNEKTNQASQRYLNRLSDLLFVLARVLARRDGAGEVIWRKGI